MKRKEHCVCHLDSRKTPEDFQMIRPDRKNEIATIRCASDSLRLAPNPLWQVNALVSTGYANLVRITINSNIPRPPAWRFRYQMPHDEAAGRRIWEPFPCTHGRALMAGHSWEDEQCHRLRSYPTPFSLSCPTKVNESRHEYPAADSSDLQALATAVYKQSAAFDCLCVGMIWNALLFDTRKPARGG